MRPTGLSRDADIPGLAPTVGADAGAWWRAAKAGGGGGWQRRGWGAQPPAWASVVAAAAVTCQDELSLLSRRGAGQGEGKEHLCD